MKPCVSAGLYCPCGRDMKIASICSISFVCLLVAGCVTCVPGICGCAFSWLPSEWEQYYALPAIAADLIGFVGAVVSTIVLVILSVRRQRHQPTGDQAP